MSPRVCASNFDGLALTLENQSFVGARWEVRVPSLRVGGVVVARREVNPDRVRDDGIVKRRVDNASNVIELGMGIG